VLSLNTIITHHQQTVSTALLSFQLLHQQQHHQQQQVKLRAVWGSQLLVCQVAAAAMTSCV
jgi:hypothetical protein